MRTVVLFTLLMTVAGPVGAQSGVPGATSADPVFVGQEVRTHRSMDHPALVSVERAGLAIWDHSSGHWYAAANGTVVQIADDGRLLVVADGVQGDDIDVRLAAGEVVSREPDDRIVLHQAGPRRGRPTTLLEGPNYFHPRFSPEGDAVIVHESRAAGSRIWLVALNGLEPRVLCQGVAGAWHPDGLRVVFSRVDHDSLRVTGASLLEVDVATGSTRVLPTPRGVAPVEPAVSPDGSQLAFVDALTGRLLTVPYPQLGEEVGHAR